MGSLAARRTSDVAFAAPPRQTRDDDIAAMVINGEIIMIDTADYEVAGQDLCAVIRWDGKIELQFPKLAHERSYLGKRTGFFGNGDMTKNGSVHLLGCLILGKVINAD